jgi:AAA+ ATPase superfamily predicted ATPase
MRLIARKREIDLLGKILSSPKPEFVALYGRRRVGKTFLIHEFFKQNKNIFYFQTTGQKDGSIQLQIDNFCSQIEFTFKLIFKMERPKSWNEVFKVFNDHLLQIKNKKIVIFLDELPWLASHKSQFIQSLDYIWNQHWSKDSKIKLITCGSAASWMNDNIIEATGGLHNRLTRKILLEPFKFPEVKEYLKSQKIKLMDSEILKLYMVFGGVPYYWSLIPKGNSASQIVEALIFKKDGELRNEFHRLFQSLFDQYEVYEKIVRALANSKSGLDRNELLKATKLQTGGTANKYLKNLEHSGFIESFIPYGNKKKNIYFRLIDEFCLFSISWERSYSNFSQIWGNQQGSPKLNTWAGYAFENFCLHHKEEIAKALGIQSLTSGIYSWRHTPPKKSTDSGAQIDLIFERKDGCLNFVEIKYSKSPYKIEKPYAQSLATKEEVFRKLTNFKGQIFTNLISPEGLKHGLWDEDVIDSAHNLDDIVGN